MEKFRKPTYTEKLNLPRKMEEGGEKAEPSAAGKAKAALTGKFYGKPSRLLFTS